MNQLSNHTKIIKLADAQGAAASDYSSATVVDTAGYEGARFIVQFGTSAANNGVKVQQDTASGFSTGADIEGSKKLLDATAKVAIVDIFRPRERYLKPIVLRGTSSTIDCILVELYGPRVQPTTDDASVNSEKHVSPAEGTA